MELLKPVTHPKPRRQSPATTLCKGTGCDCRMPNLSVTADYGRGVSAARQVEKAPTESYADVGGLEAQIQEIKEAVELPLTHPELYEDIGIKPPKVPPPPPRDPTVLGAQLVVGEEVGGGGGGEGLCVHSPVGTALFFPMPWWERAHCLVGGLLDCCGVALSTRCAGCDPLWRAGDREDPSSEGRGQPDLGHIPASGRLRAHPEVPRRRPQAGAGVAPPADPGVLLCLRPLYVVSSRPTLSSEHRRVLLDGPCMRTRMVRGCSGQVRELFRVADELSPTIVFIGATCGLPPGRSCMCQSDCRTGRPCCLPVLTHGELCVQTRSMPLVRSGMRLPAGGSARSSAPCWNCSISWTASTAWVTSRCSPILIEVNVMRLACAAPFAPPLYLLA